LTVAEIFDAGAQRISLGSWLAWVAIAAMANAAEEIRDSGEFSALAVRVPVDDWLGG
jgi:2-methylisocitrate lyase-like PEP mutase family enzyme